MYTGVEYEVWLNGKTDRTKKNWRENKIIKDDNGVEHEARVRR